MRKRRQLSLIISVMGVALLVGAILVWILYPGVPLNPTVLVASGVGLLIIGVLVFVADLFETFLNRGQTALVDGLQAG